MKIKVNINIILIFLLIIIIFYFLYKKYQIENFKKKSRYIIIANIDALNKIKWKNKEDIKYKKNKDFNQYYINLYKYKDKKAYANIVSGYDSTFISFNKNIKVNDALAFFNLNRIVLSINQYPIKK